MSWLIYKSSTSIIPNGHLFALRIGWVHSDQTGRMPRLIWVFAGRTLTLLVLSCRSWKIVTTKFECFYSLKTFTEQVHVKMCLSHRWTAKGHLCSLTRAFGVPSNNMSRLMTKPTKWHVCPAKTQISLGIWVFAGRTVILLVLSWN